MHNANEAEEGKEGARITPMKEKFSHGTHFINFSCQANMCTTYKLSVLALFYAVN